jgi:hypothetical protein
VRVLLRLLSPLLGLAVAAAGALLAAEVGWAWARPHGGHLLVPWPSLVARLGDHDWASRPVRLTAAAVAVAGLLLLLVAATARCRDVRLRDPAPGIAVTTSPRSLARLVGHRVRAEDGVGSASVTASHRRVRVRATSRFESGAELRPRLVEVVGEVVDALPVPRAPRVSVAVSSPKDRA